MSDRTGLWTCPRCQRQLVNRNQWHSCGRYTIRGYLRGKSRRAVALFHRFVEAMESVGEFTYAPAKTRIGFQRRIIFAAINRIGEDYLDGHLILKRTSPSEKFYRIELETIHHFRISRPEEIDEEFLGYLREAYHRGG